MSKLYTGAEIVFKCLEDQGVDFIFGYPGGAVLPIYDWFKSTRSNYENDDFFKIYIDFPRNELVKRISDRTADMIKKGAISEVKKFIRLKVPRTKTASKAIGIAEIRDYLNKKIEISEVIEKISIKTRQYAKRQSTWGRGNMVDWNKIKSEDLNKFLKKI